MRRPLTTILCAALAFGAATTAAHAEEIRVGYADLNLATVEGQEALEARIERAAKIVCGYNDIHTGSRMMSQQIERCYQQAKRGATVQMASLVGDVRYGG